MFELHSREVDSILRRVAECDRLRRDIEDHGEDARIHLGGRLAEMERSARELEVSIRQGREEMRRHGLIPPELPASLRYLDEEPGT